MSTNENEVTGRWIDHLKGIGAVYRDGRIDNFGHPDLERQALPTGHVLTDLSHLALIRAVGPDTKSFLNGQLTNDINGLDRHHTQLSAWCSAKGRMLAIFRVIPEADGYLLQLPASLAEEIIKRLRMYVMRAKVTLAPADDSYVRIGFAGPDATTRFRDAIGEASEGNDGLVLLHDVMALRLPGIHPRYEILCTPAKGPQIWEQLSRDATPAGADAWNWHDVMAGLPTVLPETHEAFVPQMANLELLQGVSFNKGCYTGQEIVARVHYLGKLKQRMYRAHTSAATPAPGTPIYVHGGTQSTGTVVIGAPAPGDGSAFLAVIHTESAEKETLHLEHPDGPRLKIEPLPYTVT